VELSLAVQTPECHLAVLDSASAEKLIAHQRKDLLADEADKHRNEAIVQSELLALGWLVSLMAVYYVASKLSFVACRARCVSERRKRHCFQEKLLRDQNRDVEANRVEVSIRGKRPHRTGPSRTS
jgi:hypothetical protein